MHDLKGFRLPLVSLIPFWLLQTFRLKSITKDFFLFSKNDFLCSIIMVAWVCWENTFVYCCCTVWSLVCNNVMFEGEYWSVITFPVHFRPSHRHRRRSTQNITANFQLNAMRNCEFARFRLIEEKKWSFYQSQFTHDEGNENKWNRMWKWAGNRWENIFRVRCQMRSLNLDLSTIGEQVGAPHSNASFHLRLQWQLANPLESFHYALVLPLQHA